MKYNESGAVPRRMITKLANMYEILFLLSLAAVALGYFVFKPRKLKRSAMLGGTVAAVLLLTFAGAFGVGPFLGAGGPGAPPAQAGLWTANIDAADADTATDRAVEIEVEAASQHSITWIINDGDVDALGDIGVEVDMTNANAGATTDIWSGEVSLVSVPNILVSGIPTAILNYTADRTRFNFVIAEGTTFTAGDVTQDHDKGTFTATSKATQSVVITMPVDPAVVDDNPAGMSFSVVWSVGGILITLTVQES